MEHTRLTAAERSARSRLGAHKRWATSDRFAGVAPARAGFMAKFEREVDPDGELDAQERAVRADHAMRAYMQRLAMKRHQGD